VLYLVKVIIQFTATMDREGVIKFIQDKLTQGTRDEQILGDFIGQGWNFRDVSQLLNEAKTRMVPPSPQPKQGASQVPATANIQQAPISPANNVPGNPRKRKTGLIIGIAVLVLALCAGGAYAYFVLLR